MMMAVSEFVLSMCVSGEEEVCASRLLNGYLYW
jgi:hypothetical protein